MAKSIASGRRLALLCVHETKKYYRPHIQSVSVEGIRVSQHNDSSENQKLGQSLAIPSLLVPCMYLASFRVESTLGNHLQPNESLPLIKVRDIGRQLASRLLLTSFDFKIML